MDRSDWVYERGVRGGWIWFLRGLVLYMHNHGIIVL